MRLPKYPLASSDKMMTFEFISEGHKGLIHKIVRYQLTNLKGVYNLAFGGGEQIPLILDDCFIELDDIRFLKCIKYLIEKTDMQIFYFTAHKRIFDLPLENEVKCIL